MIIWTDVNDEFEEEMINESTDDKIIMAKWSSKGEYIIIIL